MIRRGSSFLSLLWRQQSGASAVELALVTPVLLLLLTGAIDIGSLAWTQMQVAAAARAGASYALSRGFNVPEINSAVTSATNLTVTVSPSPTQSYGCPNAATGVTTAGVTSSTNCPSGPKAGRYVTVGATATYTPLFSLPFLSDPVALSSTTTVRIS